MAAAQAKVGGASYSHVADGALEGQTFTHGTLSPTGLAATVAAVHSELWRGRFKQLHQTTPEYVSDKRPLGLEVTYRCLCEVQEGRKQTSARRLSSLSGPSDTGFRRSTS